MTSPVTAAVNLVLAGAAAVCLLALAYFFYHYGWTGEREFSSGQGPFLYYLLPAALAALFVRSLWFAPRSKARLALVTASSVLALYAVEIVMDAGSTTVERTIWSPTTDIEMQELVEVATRHGVTYDTRSQLQVVADMRASGVNAVPAVYPNGFFDRQPDGSLTSQFVVDGVERVLLGGVSGRNTVFCNESGEWELYDSDERGFHNPRGLWSSSRLDVVVLGDSYAHGACVASERNFVSAIRSRHAGTLNLGMSSMGPLMALAALKEYAAGFRPPLVVWFLYEENDFADLSRERQAPALMKYLERDAAPGLAGIQPEIDRWLEAHIEARLAAGGYGIAEDRRSRIALPAFLRLGNIRGRLRLVHGKATAGEPQDHRIAARDTLDRLDAVVLEAKRTVETWGGRLYLVYLPERERYADPRIAELDEVLRAHVVELAASLDVALIDIHAAFLAHGDPLSLFPFRRRGHYNDEGHRLVGETVLRALAAPSERTAPPGP